MVKFTIRGKLPGLNDYIAAERANRYKGAEMKRQAETVVLHAARALGKWRAGGEVHMVYRWYEANQRRDKDNVSSFGRKVIQDALVKGKYLPNDGWKDIEDFEDRFSVSKKNPRIEVEIWEGSDYADKALPLKAAMDALLAALREVLSPRQYEAYWLYEIEGLSGKEIAYQLGISQSAASRHLTAARAKIRRAYDGR